MNTKEYSIQKCSEIFLYGFEGLEYPERLKIFHSQHPVAGFILFAKNYTDLNQLRTLCAQIKASHHSDSSPYWISVDHEGGRIQRFKKDFTQLPSAQEIGLKNDLNYTQALAKLAALELKKGGINLNYVPVADILTEPNNPVMKTRTYGTDADTVSQMLEATIKGYLSENVSPCMKHFPGHGDTTLDSHYALPICTTAQKTLLSRELTPFTKGASAGCPVMMTAHVIYTELDDKYPATLSSKVLSLAQEVCNFDGVIITDDMEMQAITDHYPDAPILALQAGCHVLLYRSEAGFQKSFEVVRNALKTDKLDPQLILNAIQKIQAAKNVIKG